MLRIMDTSRRDAACAATAVRSALAEAASWALVGGAEAEAEAGAGIGAGMGVMGTVGAFYSRSLRDRSRSSDRA